MHAFPGTQGSLSIFRITPKPRRQNFTSTKSIRENHEFAPSKSPRRWAAIGNMIRDYGNMKFPRHGHLDLFPTNISTNEQGGCHLHDNMAESVPSHLKLQPGDRSKEAIDCKVDQRYVERKHCYSLSAGSDESSSTATSNNLEKLSEEPNDLACTVSKMYLIKNKGRLLMETLSIVCAWTSSSILRNYAWQHQEHSLLDERSVFDKTSSLRQSQVERLFTQVRLQLHG